MTNSLPEKLGKYKIIEEVGRGGFAAVYKAVDTTLDRTVALKVLAPHLLSDVTFVQRFQREAKVSANLDHPNIVTIYEVSQVEGIYFIAMQFLEGRTLEQILEAEGPLSVSRSQVIVEQIASALDYAHARGFVHRDVKPSNVIIAEDGRATLTDFGLVKAGEGSKLTVTGMVFGTPAYMSPEQGQGDAVDARSDIYSLGTILFEILAGRVPYEAETPIAVTIKHITDPVPRPTEFNPAIPKPVERVVLKALAKGPADRYQSAGEMVRALTAAIETKAALKVEGGKQLPIAEKPEPEVPPPEAMFPTILERIQPFEPEMVLIPAGEFLMGSNLSVDQHAESEERPQHALYLPDYYLAKTPVTNTQYAAFVQATGHAPPEHWEKRIFGRKPPRGQEDHPVVYVSWHDAVAYCRWLTEVTGKPYRLPGEAEWEKGARGSDRRIYPWGNQWDAKRCNVEEASKSDTTPVGAYPEGASPYGLLDMAGNVWEWTRSLWGRDWRKASFKYPYDPADGREDLGVPDSVFRVLRGGSFNIAHKGARCASRGRDAPHNRSKAYGFRVCVVPR